MILIEATLRYRGYDPNTLLHGSGKKVCCSCDSCGKVRWLQFRAYHSLCSSCIQKDKKITNETRKKMSDAKRGYNHPMYGKHHSEESKKKISKSNKGKKLSDEERKNIGEGHKGIICTKETKEKISKANKGKKRSKDFCKSISGDKNSMYGKCGKLAPNWKGGLPLRDHVLNESQCIKLNKRFPNSEGHHIMSGVIIYLPKNLHKSIWHNMRNKQNMKEINKIAYNWLIGDLNNYKNRK